MGLPIKIVPNSRSEKTRTRVYEKWEEILWKEHMCCQICCQIKASQAALQAAWDAFHGMDGAEGGTHDRVFTGVFE